MGEDVVKTIKDLFGDGQITPNLNGTNIISIPKIKNPSSVGDLRPILLCNVLMKLVTKVIANIMKPVLTQVVLDTQSAFVPGRVITDNVMVSFEVLHYLKRKQQGRVGYMALKLDIK